MRIACHAAIICAVLATIGGCQNKKPANAQEAMSRVDAALQIDSPTQKDEALALASRDAAKAGAGEAVLKGVQGIGSPTKRDEVAEDCAYKLRDAGQGSTANEVAKLIGSPTKRDVVLKKLASGS
jgi:hypothetical protein